MKEVLEHIASSHQTQIRRILIGSFFIVLLSGFIMSCNKSSGLSAKEILGNPDYMAICYGGYRESSRDVQPTVEQLKEDVRILHAMGIRLLRTYNVHLDETSNLLKAISELKNEDPGFEMYLMLGAWIDCYNAWTGQEPDHEVESERNEVEIARAVELTSQYPDIVKILAVGNEAMVHWQTSYYVQPGVILKWVKYLQQLKRQGELPEDLWITSSDDYASWGGGESIYHKQELNELIEAVDYISMHTYPYLNTYYNPDFWYVTDSEDTISDHAKIDSAMRRSMNLTKEQYSAVSEYMKSLGVEKPIHIGESGWSTISSDLFGQEGTKAADEYKQGLYFKLLKEWTESEGITCFYFEAFDESWKDAENPMGSENHFGLFTLKGQAKYALWDLVDQGVFDGLSRDGKPVTKTYEGDINLLLQDVLSPPGRPKTEPVQ